MLTENQVLKYINVRKLAERGEPGEKDNAARVLRRLEKEHPSIRQEADAYLKRQASNTRSHSGSASQVGNWENIFQYARVIYDEVYTFASTVAESQYGRVVAAEASGSSRLTTAGNLLITVKMKVSTYQQALQLNPLQRQAFREELHKRLEEQLDHLFST